MVYKRYESPFEKKYTSCPDEEFIKPKNKPKEDEKKCNENSHPKTSTSKSPASLGFLDNLAYDDIILIGLIIILLGEDKKNRDVPLILTLAFLFLIQYIDAD